MRILQLTPGTGNFHCGSCLHDLARVRALRARGHDVLMVPLYMPFVADSPADHGDTPVFLGGLSVYLAQKGLARGRVPAWLNRALRAPGLLRAASRLVGLTAPRDLGESAVSMLKGEAGGQAGELERLLEWLRTEAPFDVVCLSNSLLAGMARRIKETLRIPVVCAMQGEDYFLDGLPEPYRAEAWELLAARAADVDRFTAVSRYYAELMGRRLGLAAGRVSVVYPGLESSSFAPAESAPEPPALGYLARMHPSKGLHTLVDAFLLLAKGNRTPGLRLRIAGAKTGPDERYVAVQRSKLAAAGLADRAEFLPNLDLEAKRAFLRGLTVFSVPAAYGEAFGLYLLEAWASGVPVVQPRHGAFPELLAATGGGVLCAPDSAASLAEALDALLLDPALARRLGEAGRQAAARDFSPEAMARNTEALLASVVGPAKP